ncbi:hypothetical protein HPP92_000256 [Vanilla planifolia]|uniref:RING-type E3 ubiquitin transferase n=1 Tax=Vanilla planifolia TaxID=51239 RepID=A0A835VFX5_VANPL|nr:hypothetical protein HPP92_000256 [Vanilla planifolia]
MQKLSFTKARNFLKRAGHHEVMSFFFSKVLLLQLIGISSLAEGLSNDCPPSWCGGLEIKLPFTLESSPESCGNGAFMKLSCSSRNETILSLYPLQKLTKLLILTNVAELTVALSSSINCPWMNSYSPNTNGSTYTLLKLHYVLLNCTQKLPSKTEDDETIVPISCLRGTGGFVYAMDNSTSLTKLSPHCKVRSSSGSVPLFDGIDYLHMPNIIERPKVVLCWNDHAYNMRRTCLLCELEDGKDCGFNKETNNTFCISTDEPHKGKKSICSRYVKRAHVL